jgi:Flp pilus assembly protein CpaB
MKKPHNKAYLVIAGLALLAFVLTYALFSGVVAPKPVVVAKADMAAGTRLTADLLELRTLPGAAVPKGAYSSLAAAEGKVLTTARVAGDPITAYVAGESTAASGIPAQLDPNTVAISIKVDQATGLAGVLRPGQTVTVIAVVDPSHIQQNSLQSLSSPVDNTQATPVAGTTPAAAQPKTDPTPSASATSQPPVSVAARIVITGLKVLIVPQSFRYVETGSTGSSNSFLPATTSASQQQSSVILLEAPLTPIEIAPGVLASPAELLALLNQTAVIHLALEPANGLTIRVEAVPAIDLATLYEGMTGYHLNP